MNAGESFRRYELHERVLEALPQLGFTAPTQVQEKVIPLFMQKRNLVVEAPTGTGKTAAYGLPLISRLDLMKKSTQALVMVPSRELALQISGMLRSYIASDQMKVAAVYGGVPMEESFEAIKSGSQILVAVPGRLKDVMAHYKWDYLWRDIRFLIIDEGDKLLEQGFQRDFDDLRQHVRSTAQVGFFSATISQDAEDLIRERFRRVKVLRMKPKDLLKNLKFYDVKAKQGQREAYLVGLIRERKLSQALIFAGRRENIFTITGFLRNCGYQTESFYGNQEQQEREQILQRFKSGHIQFLVASDLAARGIDIPDLPAVINLSMPSEYDFYLHRVGRTGRAGNVGRVYNVLVSDVERVHLRNHHRLMGLKVKEMPVKPLAKQQVEAAEEDKWVKYHLSRGKRDKVRKADVVGFLTREAGIAAEDIGTITIYDSYAVVDLPKRAYDQLKALPEPWKLKGKSLKVRKYSIEEQDNKARSVHRLKQDRR